MNGIVKKTKIEVCINCDSEQSITESVSIAFLNKASTVELCSSMEFDGLTPSSAQIVEAREAFKERKGLMVMIRPRRGDFNYTKREIKLMREQIKSAAEDNADGVVFGVLKKEDNTIAVDELNMLVELAKKLNLKTTFHRAFDATPDFLNSLEILIEAGVDRVLTSGTKWQDKQPARMGIETLKQIINLADNRIEVVIGGGIDSHNAAMILGNLPTQNNRLFVHAYSGVKQNGLVTEFAVRELVKAVQQQF